VITDIDIAKKINMCVTDYGKTNMEREPNFWVFTDTVEMLWSHHAVLVIISLHVDFSRFFMALFRKSYKLVVVFFLLPDNNNN
jgi:hypothetical protein